MNKVTLMGRFTKDPEIRTATTGGTVLKFILAVVRSFKKEGEEKQCDFISCTAFSKTADNIAKFFTKGRMIIISGRIQTGFYEKEGQKIYTTDVICDEFFFAGDKKSESSITNENNLTANTSEHQSGFVDMEDSELPF